jgi:ubiquinone biosynthesis monooxygenase Coq6
LIVAADGSRSPVRQEIGLGWIGQSYDQRAVVAVVENHQPNRMAIQRFLPNGPVAVLPMGGNGQYSNIVWSTNESEADWLESKATESQFLDALHTALHSAEPRQVQRMANKPALTTQRLHAMVPTFRRLVPSAEDRRDRKSFPLHFGSATTYDANRTVLVGDAAHVVHPLAGQGVNLGIADAETLAGVLQHAWRTGRDVGDSSLLAAYTRQRLPVNTMMLLTLSTLRRLFALPSVTRGLGADLASSARGLGLRTLEVVSPLRAALVRIATGDYGS